MIHSQFLFPEILADTPRLFTAIAEWLAIFVYLNIYKRRFSGYKYLIACVLSLLGFCLFHFVAGLMPLVLWIPSIIGAVVLIYVSLFFILDIKYRDCYAIAVQAFVLAEFSASVYRQLYVWETELSGKDSFPVSLLFMVVIYLLIYSFYFKVEKDHFREGVDLNISRIELVSVLSTAIGVFVVSNLIFVWSNTPLSAATDLLYVRTLIDFAGLLMLITQMEHRNEMAIKIESDAMNQLFTKQYEHYKLSIDNSELLRREIHDMKHYLAALKNEDDPVKRSEVLADMEQAIAIQEAFMNTGNQVLDIILTTKSLQCEKKGISLNAMVDGDVLKGIYVKDLCSLFGNILDNAIEATQQVENAEKRFVSLSVKKKNQFIIIECENYSDVNPRLKNIEKGMFPETTKGDRVHHGFGLKSIQSVAEKYSGAMTISEKDGWFKVKVLLGVKQ